MSEHHAVNYSRVWEDWETLYEALEVKESDVILSITSAGDNALNLLLQKPKSVVCVDSNPAQNALLELKLSAIRQLNHDQFLELLGIKPSQKRQDLFLALNLPAYAKEHWNNNIPQLEAGLVDSGSYDQYLYSHLQTKLQGLLKNEEIDHFLDSKTLEEQQKHFETWPLQDLHDFLRKNIAEDICARYRAGLSPSAQEVNEDKLALHLIERFAHVCMNVPVTTNIYLDLFLRSSRAKYQDVQSKQPPYLRRENYEKLKELVDRVVVVNDKMERFIDQVEPGTFSKANLSNALEYFSEEGSDSFLEKLADKMVKGGRMVNWNIFIPRAAATNMGHKFKALNQLANSLHKKDKFFYYKALHVDERL